MEIASTLVYTITSTGVVYQNTDPITVFLYSNPDVYRTIKYSSSIFGLGILVGEIYRRFLKKE